MERLRRANGGWGLLAIWISDREVAAVPAAVAAPWIEEALRERHSGTARAPVRQAVPLEGGLLLSMPGALSQPPTAGVKLVLVHGHGVDGAVVVLDGATGRVAAVVEARALTVLRTAALSLVAARLLVPGGGSCLAVLGAGAQGEGHARALSGLPGVQRVRLWNRHRPRAEGLARRLQEERPDLKVEVADSPREAVAEADLLVTATSASAPLFAASDAPRLRHVTAVGSYRPDCSELPLDLVAQAQRLVVDTREGALAEAGEVVQALAQGRIAEGRVEDLAEVWAQGPWAGEGLTVFKSVGSAVWDLAVARGLVGYLARASGSPPPAD